jgi:hypothetical protein
MGPPGDGGAPSRHSAMAQFNAGWGEALCPSRSGKSEIRNPKSETISASDFGFFTIRVLDFPHRSFGIYFGFRASDFGF